MSEKITHIRIYQINMDRDRNGVIFLPYELLPKFQGCQEVDSSLYDMVYDCQSEFSSLEAVFSAFNTALPKDYTGRSLSVSDVIEVIRVEGKSEFFYCDSIGFKEIRFDPENTQKGKTDRRKCFPEDRIERFLLFVELGKKIATELASEYQITEEDFDAILTHTKYQLFFIRNGVETKGLT